MIELYKSVYQPDCIQKSHWRDPWYPGFVRPDALQMFQAKKEEGEAIEVKLEGRLLSTRVSCILLFEPVVSVSEGTRK